MTWQTDYLKELQEDPKVQILHTLKGAKAVDAMKFVLFKDDYASAEAKRWSSAIKKPALFLCYSRLLRKNKVIIFQLVAGTEDVLGEKFTYEKGMKMLADIKGYRRDF